jgi:hypothetical protein
MVDRGEQVSVRTERADEGRVKVVWGDSTGARFPPYRLEIDWLSEKAEAARLALENLGTVYRAMRPDFTNAISELVKYGQALRRALFEDCLPDDRHAASEPQSWFDSIIANSVIPVTINVYADPILPIPWGVLHDETAVEMDGDTNADCSGFWAIRHQVATLYNGMAPQRLWKHRPAKEVMLLSGLHQEAFDSIVQHLKQEQREFIGAFLDKPVGRAFTTQGCRQRWQQVGDRDCVIYLFGHATGSELKFSDEDLLTAITFRNLFRRESRVLRPESETSYVLTFLNGCASVSGQEAESFLMATADPGFCGYIGAEAVVPDRFALLYGQEFLYLLLIEGLSVREAMTRLLRKHTPMALFYGCYAHPDFAVTREDSSVKLPADFDFCNFLASAGKCT